jgi:hypothetical protein
MARSPTTAISAESNNLAPKLDPRAKIPSSGLLKRCLFAGDLGVSEGTRTPDRRDHNPELYQLSYAHRVGSEV